MILEKIKTSIINFGDGTEEAVKKALANNIEIKDIIRAISEGLDEVGNLYENREYFLSELILSGEAAKKGIELILPQLDKEKSGITGTVVFGTVKGDIHDIGKTIVSAFLIGAGFIVHDLGVEVTSENFIKAVKEKNADILALSTLLTNTMHYMKEVIDALEEEGLRNKVKVIVGGRPVSEEFANKIGADGFAQNPFDAKEICKNWMKE
ncbi:MAG: cobalamin-binding protein [Candidatus Lokiarchaeota archaeon]|nr:cobalamin-binding protein [Candidatus Lokiarchaeota archaeon]